MRVPVLEIKKMMPEISFIVKWKYLILYGRWKLLIYTRCHESSAIFITMRVEDNNVNDILIKNWWVLLYSGVFPIINI